MQELPANTPGKPCSTNGLPLSQPCHSHSPSLHGRRDEGAARGTVNSSLTHMIPSDLDLRGQ